MFVFNFVFIFIHQSVLNRQLHIFILPVHNFYLHIFDKVVYITQHSWRCYCIFKVYIIAAVLFCLFVLQYHFVLLDLFIVSSHLELSYMMMHTLTWQTFINHQRFCHSLYTAVTLPLTSLGVFGHFGQIIEQAFISIRFLYDICINMMNLFDLPGM